MVSFYLSDFGDLFQSLLGEQFQINSHIFNSMTAESGDLFFSFFNNRSASSCITCLERSFTLPTSPPFAFPLCPSSLSLYDTSSKSNSSTDDHFAARHKC